MLDLVQLVQLVNNVPYIGPFAIYLPPIVFIGSVLSVFLKPPKEGANVLYVALYQITQWCALNKGQATNLVDPKNNNLLAGASALSNPTVVVEAKKAPVVDPNVIKINS